jgi:predicted RNase H-like HicB family nuclease
MEGWQANMDAWEATTAEWDVGIGRLGGRGTWWTPAIGFGFSEASMEYLVVIERGPTSVRAYIPDLPDCVAAGETLQDVESLIREAMAFHIEGPRAAGQRVPAPSSSSQFVSIDA